MSPLLTQLSLLLLVAVVAVATFVLIRRSPGGTQ